MSKDTPTPAALTVNDLAQKWKMDEYKRQQERLNDIRRAYKALKNLDGPYAEAMRQTIAMRERILDAISPTLPLDPGEAPAPAGDAAQRNHWIEHTLHRLSNQLQTVVEDMQAEGHRGWLGYLKEAAKMASDLERAGIAWHEMPKDGTPSPQGLGEARTPREVPRECWVMWDKDKPLDARHISILPKFPADKIWVRMVEAPAPAPKGEALGFGKTNRGFAHATFEDTYGHRCSIQKSSLATEDCIWLGSDEPPRRHLGDWLSSRMHLSRETVASLLPALHHFVATGDLPAPESPHGSVSEANRPNPNSNPSVTPSAAPQGQEESK